MKKVLLVLILLTAGHCCSQSQKNHFGFKAGITYVADFGDITYEKRIGKNFDFFYQSDLNNRHSIAAEIGYNQKGFFKKTFYKGAYIDYKDAPNHSLNYISFKILYKYYINQKTVKPYLNAGFRFEVLMNNSYDFADLFTDGLYFYNNYYGFTIGGGAEFKNILPITLIADLSYNTDISYYIKYSDRYKNRTIEAKLGIKF